MFTGIIQYKAIIKRVEKIRDTLSINFVIPGLNTRRHKISLGDSVSLDGVCSTIARISGHVYTVEYMRETLSKTTVSQWHEGYSLNIETSLRIGDKIDGHFVYGHIDTLGTIKSVSKDRDMVVYEVRVPKEFLKFVVYKGSVAINGVSLTVSRVTGVSFEVSLIPYTLANTTLKDLRIGDNVNIETDILAKYILKSQKLKTK